MMKFVVLLLLCVFVSGDVEVLRCIEREREALLSFKNGLTDEDGFLRSWQRTDDCCKWYGVVCSNTTSHVIHLELSTADFDGVLGGKVSSSLLELHHLTYLDLSCNDFRGDRIPGFISSMKQLQHLYLSNSVFSGIIPPQLGNLTNLHTLDLSRNYLKSENLIWLSNLSSLSLLDLSYSNLNNTNWLQHILQRLPSLQELHLRSCNIPDVKSLAGLFVNTSSSSSLSILDLRGNILTSSAFDWLFNVCMNAVHVDMSDNALGGQIPNTFEGLTHLEYLDLSLNTLEGEIPKSLGNLSHLQVLGLYDNKLGGRPDELIGNLSAKGLLSSLQILDLAENQFDGTIPDLTAFSALTEVYLGTNNLVGSLPLSLGHLSNLIILEVSRNQLEGGVSESHLAKFENLRKLDLSFNSLSLDVASDWNPPFQLKYLFLSGCQMGPSFPTWIKTQRNLSMLDLSSSGIIGEVPVWLWSFSPFLKSLFLSYNQITGTIPDLSSTSIIVLDISSNKMSGPIPLFHSNTLTIQLRQNMLFGSVSSICQIPHLDLKFLDLSHNQLSGEIPSCFGRNSPNLSYIHLANNNFSGEIPHSLGSLTNLGSLRLSDNNLSGEFPSTLRFCQELRLIDVEGNKLTGNIPTWIVQIYDILILNLRSNKFYGGLPPEICNLTHIRVLDLSRNNLSGTIPDCFNNFATLAQKNATQSHNKFGFVMYVLYDPKLLNVKFTKVFNEYSSVQWKGQDSEYRKNLVLLTLIDFSSNRLIGNIPGSLSSLMGLVSLNLSRNNLTGNMNPHMGQMEMLECLDLSHNQLTGGIPTSLARLHFLAFLDLSNNNLSGKIPSCTQLQSFNASSYAGNNGLCGIPMALCPEDRLKPPAPKHGDKDDGFGGLQGLIISMAFGFILGFWGVVGSFILKKSWRYAYFKLLDDVGDWFYVRITIFLSKWRKLIYDTGEDRRSSWVVAFNLHEIRSECTVPKSST